MKFKTALTYFLTVIMFTGQITAQNELGDTLTDLFENTVWNADELIGRDPYHGGEANLVTFVNLNFKWPYGNITEFKNNKFIAYNRGFCGNECKMFITGTYRIYGNKIDLFVDSISYLGECPVAPAIMNKTLGTFYWVKNDSVLRFLRNPGDIPQLAHLDYLNNLQNHLPAFKYITSTQVIMEFISVYNRYMKRVPDSNNAEYKGLANVFESWKQQEKNWESDAEKFKITGEAEYKEYKKIASELYKILAGLPNRQFE